MKIALLGNPNTGKSSVFNMLTGLRQHVGNFPGVTVDKKVGTISIEKQEHQVIDFPGTYSIYPHSKEERIVYDVLSDAKHADYPDVAVVIVDASNLERNLFLFTQIYDLGIPTVLVLNMSDVAKRKGKEIVVEELEKVFPKAEIVQTNARIGVGKEGVLNSLMKHSQDHLKTKLPNLGKESDSTETQDEFSTFLPHYSLAKLQDVEQQEKEAQKRHQLLGEILPRIEKMQQEEVKASRSNKLDKVLVHPVWGYLIFASILLIIFQFIFSFATVPMDFIDGAFASLSTWLEHTLPEGVLTDLITQGIVPGIGGILIFIPQIALLFLFISVLEESGYLARVVFIMDRLMRPFGLNGKSVVPLMSSVACAIPGVMAARTIPNWKERIITILVAPLMSCSARIPVYTLLIALVIPEKTVLGIFNLQGVVLFALYSLGVVAALGIAILIKLFIRTKRKGFLLLELPSYKYPRWGNVGITVLEKVKLFVVDAGKIILAISIILWALASYGPGDDMEKAANSTLENAQQRELSESEQERVVAGAKLKHSYIGIMGKTIEPVIQPLGYDWKIGISLITSFAAREVFVGSLATIYAVHDDGKENKRLIEKLRAEKLDDGTPVYTLATGLSLMVFYVFAMQCMATLAVVKRETKSWKWPIVQLVYMGVLAYLGAMVTFNLFA